MHPSEIFDRIRPAFPPWREAVTVGATAVTSVIVVNATTTRR
jgi:hypothetical protein